MSRRSDDEIAGLEASILEPSLPAEDSSIGLALHGPNILEQRARSRGSNACLHSLQPFYFLVGRHYIILQRNIWI
jgi:hypothetical protein